MKKYFVDFMKRGLMASVGGPVIFGIVLYFLGRSGAAETLTVAEICRGIFTSAIMAFIAGGISVVYNVEKLPLLYGTAIHAAVLFADYLLIYLYNGWIGKEQILFFTGIFIPGYLIVWGSVLLGIRLRVKKLNRDIGKN